MPSRWTVVRKGKTYGPCDLTRLKQLAVEGKLRRSDSLVAEDSQQQIRAGEMPGLFPEPVAAKTSSSESHKPRIASSSTADTKQEESPQPQASSPSNSSWTTKAKEVARVTALTAERATIAGVSLPAAYEKLGQQCFRDRICVEAFAKLYAELDALQASLEQSRNSLAHTQPAKTFAERARHIVAHGGRLAAEQTLKLRQSALLKNLGQQAYERLAASADQGMKPYEAAVTVRRHVERLGHIDRDLAGFKQQVTQTTPSHRLRWKRPALIIGSVLASLLVGWLLVRPSSNRSVSKSASLAGARNKPQSNDTAVNAVGNVLGELQNITRSVTTRGRDVAREAARSAESSRKQLEETRQQQAEQEMQRKQQKPTGPSPDAMKVAEDLVKRLEWEQSPQPVDSTGRIAILPPAPRVGTATPIYTKPRKEINTGLESLGRPTLFEEHGLMQAGSVAYVWPTLVPYASGGLPKDFGSLPFFQTVDGRSRFSDFEKPQRLAATTSFFTQEAEHARFLGAAAVPLGSNTVAVVGSDILASQQPNILFWQKQGNAFTLQNAFAINPEGSPLDNTADDVATVSSAWENKIALLIKDHNGNRYKLQVWTAAGLVGTVTVARAISNQNIEYPIICAVNRSGIAALLYKSSLRLLDLDKVRSGELNLTNVEISSCSFSDAPGFENTGARSLAWSKDGKWCVVQRQTDGTKGCGIELYDAAGKLIIALDSSRAGSLRDVSEDGRKIAICRPYRPLPDRPAASSLVSEVEVVSLPDGKSSGRIVTCFAQQVHILRNGDLITGGAADGVDEHRLVSGGWERQPINRIFGGNYVTRWDMRASKPVWRIRDVDVEVVQAIDDGGAVLTTRRAKGDVAATVCYWDMTTAAENREIVDEFAVLRDQAVDEEIDRRGRITLPASPVCEDNVKQLRSGITYSEVKKLLRGVGRLEASVIVKEQKPFVQARVDYDACGSKDEVYRLTFEGEAYPRSQYYGEGLILVGWEKVRP